MNETNQNAAGAQSETEKILHAFNPDAEAKPVPAQWSEHHKRLVRLKDRLIDQQTDLQAKAQEIQPDSLKDEPSEIGTDTFQRDYALGISSHGENFLAEVMDAISRIENGTYGKCEITGERIPEDRLEAVPWTRLTVDGQRQMEERGKAERGGLGQRGSMSARGGSTPERQP